MGVQLSSVRWDRRRCGSRKQAGRVVLGQIFGGASRDLEPRPVMRIITEMHCTSVPSFPPRSSSFGDINPDRPTRDLSYEHLSFDCCYQIDMTSYSAL